VQLGPSEAGVVAIKTGVATGDALVVDGAEKVQDGARVEPTARQPGAAPAGAPARPPAPRPGA
jgi:hypothetical protein